MTYHHTKRGTTWREMWSLPEVVETYSTITAGWVCKRQSGTFEVRLLPGTRRIELLATDDETADWPLDSLDCAIRYGVDGETTETENFQIYVGREVVNG